MSTNEAIDVSHLMYPMTKLEKAVFVRVNVMPKEDMFDYIYGDLMEYYEKAADFEERDELIEMYEHQYEEIKI